MSQKSKTALPTLTFECTSAACGAKIRTTFEANLHPLIGCLICRKCYRNYGNGDFTALADGVDEAGDDNYCRWCFDGGDLYGCTNDKGANNDRCHYSFCRDCITKNVPEDPILTNEQGTSWFCYACRPEKLKHLKEAAEAAMKQLNKREFSKKDPSDKSKEKSKKLLGKKRKIGDEQPDIAKEIFTPHVLAPSSVNQSQVIPCNKEDLTQRLNTYRKTSQNCITEIGSRFGIILDMFASKELNDSKKRKLINIEIENLRAPMQEFETFIVDLKKLNCAN